MKIERKERLRQKLKALPKRARAEIRKALADGAGEMSATAKSFAPVRSGALRESIGYTFGEFKAENSNVRGVGVGGGALKDSDLTVTIHAGDAKAFYAAFVEFGTAPHEQGGIFKGAQHPGTPAHPFFFPAFRLTKKRMRGKLARSYRKAARAVAGAGG